MERDDVIIALAKLQSTQEEILRRFDENKAVTEKIDARVQKLESSLSYIYGAIAIAGFLSTLFWDFISKRFTT
jgi:hypothetical protein